MSAPPFPEPMTDEHFYARALAILVGPSRRMALFMRLCNLAYWLGMLAALGWLLSQALYRRPPVTIHAATSLTQHINAGDPIRVAYDLTRQRTCESDLTWAVYDGAQEIHRFGPVHVEAAGAPGHDSFVHAWATPSDAAPGHARLRVVLAFSCPGNYLQALYPVVVVLPDVPVEIDARHG